jgi:predicted lipid carrier protein YhbT
MTRKRPTTGPISVGDKVVSEVFKLLIREAGPDFEVGFLSDRFGFVDTHGVSMGTNG